MANNGPMPLLASSLPIDLIHHSRSASVSSASSTHSRPHSAHGLSLNPDELYFHQVHSRHPSSASSYSTGNPDEAAEASLKNQFARHIRRVRTASSPYPRELPSHSGSDSVHSSSSEADEQLAMFLAHPSQQDFQSIYLPQEQVAVHPASAFGRLSVGADQTLANLASTVKAATTTSASDRAKQIFVQAWLNANYAPYPDGNVPRQGLYTSYRRVCDQYQIPYINTATLGKAIRLCFPTIKTRRLGVRGNSKYHYCGIRPSNPQEQQWLQEYIRKSNNSTLAQQAAARANAAGSNQDGSHSDEDDDDDLPAPGSNRNSLTINGLKSPTLYAMDTDNKTPTSNSILSAAQARPNSANGFHTPAQIRRRGPADTSPSNGSVQLHPPHSSGQPSGPFLAVPPQQQHQAQPSSQSCRQLPGFPSIEDAVGPSSTSPQSMLAREVWRWFESHLDNLLESVRMFRFDQFEIYLRTFWANLNPDQREVVHAPAVAGLMAKADAIVYDEILEFLRSQMMGPIPQQALPGLRQLADKMEKILLLALENYGNTFVEPKVELGARFGHLVLRFLDIFQVTQALTSVLTNPKQLSEMRRSWTQIDFESVRNQSALVCNCRHEDLVQLLEVDFVNLLDALPACGEPVKEVMTWADGCCDRLMGAGRGANGEERSSTMSSRSVLIRWGYVTSQIMRDFTIRSDPSFGAFQILKLFMDDWIALNVLRTVALSTNSVAASVEPVIQQQFFTLSPMNQDHFANPAASGAGGASAAGNNAGAPSGSGMMSGHTPTTSSMLAALNDPLYQGGAGSAASGSGGASGGGGYGGYMEPAAHHLGVPHPNTMFGVPGDFGAAGGFVDVDVVEVGVNGFRADMEMSNGVKGSGSPGDGGGSGATAGEEHIKDEIA